MIVDCAAQRAVELGLQGFTIGRLARELGISKSGLVSHFDSKEGLQQAIIVRVAELFQARVVTPALAAERGEPRLRVLFKEWMRWLKDNPFEHGCFFIAAAAEMDDRPGPVRDEIAQLETQFLALLARLFQSGIDAGHFRTGLDTQLLAHQVNAIFLDHQLSHRLLEQSHLDERATRWFEQILESCALERH